jgi:hypothetical protein
MPIQSASPDDEPIVQTIRSPSNRSAASARLGDGEFSTRSRLREPQRFAAPAGVIDITELPEAGSTTTSATTEEVVGSHGIRLASATEEIRSPQTATQTRGVGRSSPTGGRSKGLSPQARYAHDPDYRWLRGRLEHSQFDRWKLRYIPIDGATDDFGGSVVLRSTPLLSGYERGDFVEIRGNLGQRTRDRGGFAPEFEILDIRTLGP